MYIDNSKQAFARLAALGLISEAQRRTAVAHPRRTLLASNADLSAHLVWLVEQRIVSHQELALDNKLPDGASHTTKNLIHNVLLPALDELEGRCSPLNSPLYDRLLGYRLLSPAERRRAEEADAYVWISAGQALASLVSLNIVTP